MHEQYINICLVGCVSAGKSTVLNAFFGHDYAQCKIKRTTMMPNKFMEANNQERLTPHKKITDKISEINKEIYNKTQSGLKLNLKDYGTELIFYVDNMEMNLGSNNKICIYDIPGLNDARTKDVYYEYLSSKFHEFNIILFIVDINSGLNTSDEMDILKFLIENINKHQQESNKNIKLLTIVNKADHMQLVGDQLEILGELNEMFQQVELTVKQQFIEGDTSGYLHTIPICGLDAHLYRMIKKFRDINKLSDENILRIGVNEEGSKFRKEAKEIQKSKVQLKIKDNNFVDDMIKLSGFSQIEKLLQQYITENGSKMVIENIMYNYVKIPEIHSGMAYDQLLINLKWRIIHLEPMMCRDYELYFDYLGNLIKKFNTIIFVKISSEHCPIVIKSLYDDFVLHPINSDLFLKERISTCMDLENYPCYIIDKIIELIAKFYSTIGPFMVDKLIYFTLLQKIGATDKKCVEDIFISMIKNKMRSWYDMPMHSIETLDLIIFDSSEKCQQIIKIFDLFSHFELFIQFLRLFLINLYQTIDISELAELNIYFTKHREIPMKLCVESLIISQKKSSTIDIAVYCSGVNKIMSTSKFIFEDYYIEKCKLLGDDDFF